MTFIIALLLAKGVITVKEAKLLNKTATEGTSNNNLPEMLERVQKVLNAPVKAALEGVETVDAKSLLK
jgi:hypothetical protein